MELGERLKTDFPSVKKIVIEIIKLKPPIADFTGTVSAKYSKEF
jgi:hypothetical protein